MTSIGEAAITGDAGTPYRSLHRGELQEHGCNVIHFWVIAGGAESKAWNNRTGSMQDLPAKLERLEQDAVYNYTKEFDMAGFGC